MAIKMSKKRKKEITPQELLPKEGNISKLIHVTLNKAH